MATWRDLFGLFGLWMTSERRLLAPLECKFAIRWLPWPRGALQSCFMMFYASVYSRLNLPRTAQRSKAVSKFGLLARNLEASLSFALVL